MNRKTIDRVLKEISDCLDNSLMFAALFMSLSLPDLCGKEKWPELSNKCRERYTKWFVEYVDYELNPLKYHFPESEPDVSFGAEECYKLRCSLLHAGSTDIGESINVDSFLIETDCVAFGGTLMRSGNELVIKNKEWVTEKFIYIRAIVLVKAIVAGVTKFLKEEETQRQND